MKKQLLLAAFISICCSGMYASTYPVPNFNAIQIRTMQTMGYPVSVVDPKSGVTVNWTWNGSQYVGTPVGPAPAPGPAPRRVPTRDQMVAAVNADPAGAAAAAQAALDALGIATNGPVSPIVAEYIGG